MTPTSSSPSAGSSRPRIRRCWRSAPGLVADPPLRRAARRVIALDVSDEMLRLGRQPRRRRQCGVGARLWCRLSPVPTARSMTSSPTSPRSTSPAERRSCATWRRPAASCGQAGKERCRCATRARCPGRSTWPATLCMPPRAAGVVGEWRGPAYRRTGCSRPRRAGGPRRATPTWPSALLGNALALTPRPRPTPTASTARRRLSRSPWRALPYPYIIRWPQGSEPLRRLAVWCRLHDPGGLVHQVRSSRLRTDLFTVRAKVLSICANRSTAHGFSR